MDYPLIHLTNLRNLDSILMNGLLPQKPLLDHHDKYFKKFIPNYKDKCIYTWKSGVDNIKHMNDHLFYEIWGEPRNVKIINSDDDFREMILYRPSKLGSEVTILDDQYVILEIEESFIHDSDKRTLIHAQTNDMYAFYGMPDRYCHNDNRMIILTPQIILPTQFEISGLVDCCIEKSGIILRHRSKIHLPLYLRDHNPLYNIMNII